jgi:PIF1-like helicase
MSLEEASVLLTDSLKNYDQDDGAPIPLRTDGSEYKIEDLQTDQQEPLALVLLALRKYVTGGKINDENVLRLTVSGVAGSGKSTWVNTLVSSVRKLIPNNDVISVFAPTGSAAFNAGGQTLHRGFSLPVPLETLQITANKQKYLLSRFAKTLVLIVDERSMLDATVLGNIKYYMQQSAHSGKNKSHPWGGIPIIIFVGDDYQLPPIVSGAFYALDRSKAVKSKKMTDLQFKIRNDGFEEFIEMANTVVYLEGEKRVNPDQDLFKSILRAVRSEDPEEKMTEEQVGTLLELDLAHDSFTEEQRNQIREEATHIFANREPRDRLNNAKLKKLNLENNPVARIKSKTVKTSGEVVSNNSHFDAERQPKRVLLCNNARVCLNGVNPDPKRGLYHGSMGIVKDIVYHEGQSPNSNDLPAYVLVDFAQYCGDPLIPTMPHCVPIAPHTVLCKFKCCSRTYMPLVLAYGKTAHTFQGQNVGPVTNGRVPNAIQKIIIDPGTRQFEGLNCGLFYTMLSRGTTLGDRLNKMSSAIYFEGSNFSRQRFENLTTKENNELYKLAGLRARWVQYLREHELPKDSVNRMASEEIFLWANTTTIDGEELKRVINFQNGSC